MNYAELLTLAIKGMDNAYAPYSNFRVGAALLTKSGKVYIGSNVENGSYGATICAERTAIVKAVSDGERDFEAIAIVSSSNKATFPCGICLQVISEFMPTGKVIIQNHEEPIEIYSLSDLLPKAFIINDIV